MRRLGKIPSLTLAQIEIWAVDLLRPAVLRLDLSAVFHSSSHIRFERKVCVDELFLRLEPQLSKLFLPGDSSEKLGILMVFAVLNSVS